jgi:hypothetical protein
MMNVVPNMWLVFLKHHHHHHHNNNSSSSNKNNNRKLTTDSCSYFSWIPSIFSVYKEKRHLFCK